MANLNITCTVRSLHFDFIQCCSKTKKKKKKKKKQKENESKVLKKKQNHHIKNLNRPRQVVQLVKRL